MADTTDYTPILVGAGSSIIGGALQGQAAENAAAFNSRVNAAMYTGGPFRPTIAPLTQLVDQLTQGYQNRSYIPTQAGTNQYYDQALSRLTPQAYDEINRTAALGLGGQQQAQQNLADMIASGKTQYTMEDITKSAGQLLNSDLINQQIDAYGRDINRNLGAEISAIRSADIGSGNLGSSKDAVKQAIAERGAADRMAAFRGNLVGNALNTAQGTITGNITTNLNANQQLGNMGAGVAQGANLLSGLNQSQLQQLLTGGNIAQNLENQSIQNQIGARDFNINDLRNYQNQLVGLSQVANAPGTWSDKIPVAKENNKFLGLF